MLVHLAVANGTPKSTVRLDEIVAMHVRSRTGRHQLTDDPKAADLIVLAGDLESLAEAKANKFIQQYPEKTMAYSEIDALIPYIPGVYGSASKPRGLDLRRMQSNIYFSRYGSSLNPEMRHRPNETKELLFCFRGRKDCRVRANIIDFPYKRADVQVMEAIAFMHWSDGIVGRRQSQKDYADALARSHFALCPRGMGFGSIRLFEVMEMGVAPVLLADRYALPPGPDWESFLLVVAEKDFARLPELLDAHVPESRDRGERARKAWEEFFAPEVIFDRMIDQMSEIRRQRILSERVVRWFWPLMQMRATTKPWLGSLVRNRRATDAIPAAVAVKQEESVEHVEQG
jgi:Exostosin family